MFAEVSDRSVALRAQVEDCAGLRPVAVVARRAELTVSAPLEPIGNCGFAGTVDVPREGRWFLYATFDRDDGPVEAWLPVEAGSDGTTRADRELYEPPDVEQTAAKTMTGAFLLIISGALGWATLAARPSYDSRNEALRA